MKIKYLKFKNFKAITELALNCDDTKKIMLIAGDNGVGKSSIIAGITYMLTDYLPEKLADFVRWGTKGFFLQMIFIYEGREHNLKIEYKLENKKTKKVLTIENDVDSPYENSEATNKLKTIIDPTLTLFSSVSQQGESTQILFETPTKRLEKLRMILGLDSIIDVTRNMDEDIKNEKEKLMILETEINTLSNLTFSFMDAPEVPDIEDLQDEFDHLSVKKEEFDKEGVIYREYLNKKREYDVKLAHKQRIEKEIRQLFRENQLMDLKQSIDYNAEEHNRLKEEFVTIEKELLVYKSELTNYSNYTERLDGIQDKIKYIKEELKKYTHEPIEPLFFTVDDLERLNKEKINLTVEIERLYKERKIADEGKCPTCGQDFKVNIIDIVFSIRKSKFRSSKINAEIVEKNKQLDKYNEKLRIEKQKEELRNITKKQYSSLTVELRSLKVVKHPGRNTYLVEKKDQIGKSLQQFDQLKNKFDEVENHNRSLAEQFKNNENKIDYLKEELLPYSDLQMPDVICEPVNFDTDLYETLKKKIYTHDAQIIEIKRIDEHNEKVKCEREQVNNKIENNKNEIEDILYNLKLIQESKRILEKEFTAYLIEKGTNYIKHMMNDFFRKSYGKYQIEFRQNKQSIDFFYTNDGERYAPVSMSSGFERQLLAISFRLALCGLQNHGILILDEIDSDASVENSIRMYDNIAKINSIGQIFCITHVPETQEHLIHNYNAGEVRLAA